MGTRAFAVLFACLIFSLGLPTAQSEAQTRRAFLVGNQDYKDGNIQQLKRAANDARDLAKNLEELGFDKKNIKVALDVKNKNAFDKEFEAFLKTVETGDLVFFYFSGHGVGVEAEQNNYLLFTDVKSPFAYARSQFPEKERKNADVIRVRMGQYLDAYTRDEIPLAGVSTKEIEQRIYDRRPKTALMVVDACRSLVRSENEGEEAKSTRLSSGSRLFTKQATQRNFLVLYSAAFGEQAVESLSAQDPGRNSLFTEVLRSEDHAPRAVAQGFGRTREADGSGHRPGLWRTAGSGIRQRWAESRRDVSYRADRRRPVPDVQEGVRRRRGGLAGNQVPSQAQRLRSAYSPLRYSARRLKWHGSGWRSWG